MIHYIENKPEGIMVHKTQESILFKGSMKQYLTHLLTPRLTTLEGRIKALEAIAGFKRNIPIYIDEQCCFISTHNLRAVQSILINVNAVYQINALTHSKTQIIFQRMSHTIIEQNIQIIKSRFKKANHLCQKVNTFGQ